MVLTSRSILLFLLAHMFSLEWREFQKYRFEFRFCDFQFYIFHYIAQMNAMLRSIVMSSFNATCLAAMLWLSEASTAFK